MCYSKNQRTNVKEGEIHAVDELFGFSYFGVASTLDVTLENLDVPGYYKKYIKRKSVPVIDSRSKYTINLYLVLIQYLVLLWHIFSLQCS